MHFVFSLWRLFQLDIVQFFEQSKLPAQTAKGLTQKDSIADACVLKEVTLSGGWIITEKATPIKLELFGKIKQKTVY